MGMLRRHEAGNGENCKALYLRPDSKMGHISMTGAENADVLPLRTWLHERFRKKRAGEGLVPLACRVHDLVELGFAAKGVQKRVGQEIRIGKESYLDAVRQDSQR